MLGIDLFVVGMRAGYSSMQCNKPQEPSKPMTHCPSPNPPRFVIAMMTVETGRNASLHNILNERKNKSFASYPCPTPSRKNKIHSFSSQGIMERPNPVSHGPSHPRQCESRTRIQQRDAPHPPPSGSILPRLLITSITGTSLVPAALLSLSSLSLSLTAPSPSTLSASLPAVETLCSSLCTLSTKMSTRCPSVACTAFKRLAVRACIAAKAVSWPVRELRIFCSAGSRRASFGGGGREGSTSSGNKGSGSSRIRFRDCHILFCSRSLKEPR